MGKTVGLIDECEVRRLREAEQSLEREARGHRREIEDLKNLIIDLTREQFRHP